MTFALVLAGGVGSRMKADRPKQFLEIQNKPILIHTLDKFYNLSDIDEIVVVVVNDYLDYTKDLVNKYYNSNKIKVIVGGSTRDESVIKGLNYLKDIHNLEKSDIVLTHDSVRPFVSKNIILENIHVAKEVGAASTAVKTVDTIMSSDDGLSVNQVLKRECLYNVQTPQTFRALELLELLLENKEEITELSSLYILNKKKVKIVMGSYDNFKITTSEDLERANNLLAR